MKRISVILGDITQQPVDAIVNAANETLLGGGGVDGAIHLAAGPELLAECAKLGGCRVGEAKITKGYKLPAKHVIHAVGPVWYGGKNGEPEKLRLCYSNSMTLAEAHGLRSIAFPSISTGAYRFPVELSAPIAVETVKQFIEKEVRSVERIIFVCFNLDVFKLYQKVLVGIMEAPS